MFKPSYRKGDRVKALSTIFSVPEGARGTVTQRYASVWGLYEVQFETSSEPRIVWAEDVEADGPAGILEYHD